jgi:diguanylate cyclase (GGDEF)-like protein
MRLRDRHIVFPLLLVLWIAAPDAAVGKDCVSQAQDSQRDFRCWGLDRTIVLDGRWRVKAGPTPELITPEFLDGPGWVEAEVTRALQQLELDPLGAALTYQLQIDLPAPNMPIYLRLGESYTNLKVWVEASDGGFEAIFQSRETATDQLLRLPELGASTTLVFHVENTLHPGIGGITRPPQLGTQELLESRIRTELIFGAFSTGALFLLALINLSLWLGRRYDMAPFYMAMAALIMCVRLLDTARLLPLLVPETPLLFQWQFGWYTMELFTVVWVLFVRALSPRDVPAWAVSLTAALCLSVIVASLVSGDATSMIRWGSAMRVYGFFVLMITGYVLYQLMRERAAVTRWLFAGLMVAVVAMTMDILLLTMRLTTLPSLSNYAFLLFAVLQTIHMNRRYLQALSRAETLRNELEERVEERTRELTEANRRLAEQATTDGLTGLKNRRAFNDAFSTELARLSRSSEKLCLALLDIDFFKAVNDSHGHDGGDQVLKNVAQLLQSQLRSTDTVARIGGEEFAVLLPTHHIAGAKARLEELRERIEASPLEDEDKSIFITVSIGLTEVTTEDGIKSASKRADEALYAAKRAGRNQLKTA